MRSLLIALAGFAIQTVSVKACTQPERPIYDGECWNYDAWFYESDNEGCNFMWEDWDDYCHCTDYNDVCR